MEYIVGIFLVFIILDLLYIFFDTIKTVTKRNKSDQSFEEKDYLFKPHKELLACTQCKKSKSVEEFKINGRIIFKNCDSCRNSLKRSSVASTSIKKSNLDNTKQNNEDQERSKNKDNFGKELTNKEILDEFEKQNVNLDFKTKTRIENQLNGLTKILELPYEIDVIRKEQFKHLNDIGVWYDVNGKRIVKFPKSEKFWKDSGGRDGSRGFDDWASK